MHFSQAKEFARFAIVGSVAFGIEAAVITIGELIGFGLLLPRIIGFPLAVTCTWFVNRLWSFQVFNKPTLFEYLSYVSGMLGGLVLNFFIYALLIGSQTFLSTMPLFCLIIATFVSMSTNFLYSKHLVFNKSEKLRKKK